MAISMYQASVPFFVRSLQSTKKFLKKGETYAKSKNIKPEVLLNCRLMADMLPLTSQIQIASDAAKGAGARLAGINVPKFADNEKSFADLYKRIDRTIKFLDKIKPAQMDGSEDEIITIKLPMKTIKFSGLIYLTQFAIPNFSFHTVTAYNILRHNGVKIGKLDFLGGLPK